MKSPKSPNWPFDAELRRLYHLHQLSTLLVRETDFHQLLQTFLQAAVEITQAHGGIVQLLEGSGELVIAAHMGFSKEIENYFRILPDKHPIFGTAIAKNERVTIDDIRSSPAWKGTRELKLLSRVGIRGFQSTPLFDLSGNTSGLLSTYYRTGQVPSARVLRALDFLVRQAPDLMAKIKRRDALEEAVAERTLELQEQNLALREQANQVRELSGRLLQEQDTERRRIARELHDTTGQELTILTIELSELTKNLHQPPANTKKVLAENVERARSVAREIRTLSYLLHPPTLDTSGLRSALLWYLEGFQRRTGIRVKVEAPDAMPRFSKDVEIALYRVLQESLTNVHRYSGSSTARIQLNCESDRISLTVRDYGKGMKNALPSGTATPGLGVGIPGMRERLRQLGGSLEIQSNDTGTTVVADVPVTESKPA